MAESPAAVIAKCDITYAMLADPAAARAVAMQGDGVVAGIKSSPGKAYVDVSTVDEATSQEIAKAVKDAGGRFLEVRCQGVTTSTLVLIQDTRVAAGSLPHPLYLHKTNHDHGTCTALRVHGANAMKPHPPGHSKLALCRRQCQAARSLRLTGSSSSSVPATKRSSRSATLRFPQWARPTTTSVRWGLGRA